MNKLGITLSVTSVLHRANKSVVAPAYTSKSHSKRRTWTHVEDGEQVSVVSIEEHRNRIDDRFIGVQMVERRVNGKVEAPTPGRVAVAG